MVYPGYRGSRSRHILYQKVSQEELWRTLDGWDFPENRDGLARRLKEWGGHTRPVHIVAPGKQYVLPTSGFFVRYYQDGVPRELLEEARRGF